MANENDDLMIEVTGTSNKATSALDKVISKISEFQKKIEAATPALTTFTEKMSSLAESSKAISSFKKLTSAANSQAEASKKAEANMAMYQARLDRSNLSMAKTKAQADKLSQSLQKAAESARISAANSQAFAMPAAAFAQKYNRQGKGTNFTPETAEDTYVPTPPAGASKTATEILNSKIPKASNIGVNVDTSVAQANLAKIEEFINSLNPAISNMSEEAQAQFEALAGQLRNVSMQIENQFGLYNKLSQSAASVAESTGTESEAYLKLEKRMLAADSAIGRLTSKQNSIKSEMSKMAAATDAASSSMKRFGNSTKSASNGLHKFNMRMFTMFTRIAAFRIYSAIAQGLQTGIQNIARGSSKANSTMSQLASSTLYLKNSIAAALMPALQALTPVIVQVADAISWAANQIAIFIAQVSGQKTVTIAKKTYVDYAKSLKTTGDNAGKANKKVKELQRTIMGFDELNVLNKNVNNTLASSSAKAPDYNSMFQTIKTPTANWENTKNKVYKFFDRLKDKTDKAQKNFKGLTQQAKEFIKSLSPSFTPSSVAAPALGLQAFNNSKKKYQTPIKAPAFVPSYATAPAIALANFLKSKSRYQSPITAPAIVIATAPALVLTKFLESKNTYQNPIAAPAIAVATVPAIALKTLFIPSLQTAKQKIEEFSTSTQSNVNAWGTNISTNIGKTWANVSSATSKSLSGIQTTVKSWGSSLSNSFVKVGTNIMTNMRSTFSYIPTAVTSGLNAAGTGISGWIKSASQGFADFGTNIMTNIGKTMSSWYSSFVNGLSAAWSQFTGFMRGIGNGISNWWSANKSWAAPTAAALAVVGAGVAIVATGGAAVPAVAALAPVGLATGGLITEPTYSLIGEGEDNEAVLPLNQNVFSQIANGISKSSDNSSNSVDTEKIIERMDSLETAISNMKIVMQADGRRLAESVNRGNKSINRRYSPIASS